MEGLVYFEDGTYFSGKCFGKCATAVGELVFNTSMTGYQKILTDPSYKGQIINMTYPLIGNYGISEADYESAKIHAFGFIAKDVSYHPSGNRCVKTVSEWLEEQDIPGVWNVDTRMITKKIRDGGTGKCVVSTEGISTKDAKALCERAELRQDYMTDAGVGKLLHIPAGSDIDSGGNPVQAPSGADGSFADAPFLRYSGKPPAKTGAGLRVAVIDLGIKTSILRALIARGCELYVFPYGSGAEEILSVKPDGVFISNGPGDPAEATAAVTAAKALIGKLPIFGICMGHQVLALAIGGDTYKMKYGHRGGNHGVLDVTTGRSAITSQNHGFAVEADSVKSRGMSVTHLNLNDGTVEGMSHESLPIFSVQYHPEASPGPNDSDYLFDRFMDLMRK
jgi:carbamoyl-phosphate synthase small subunit